jgi:hypothetical protein
MIFWVATLSVQYGVAGFFLARDTMNRFNTRTVKIFGAEFYCPILAYAEKQNVKKH